MRKQAIIEFFYDLKYSLTKVRLFILLLIVIASIATCVHENYFEYRFFLILCFVLWTTYCLKMKENQLMFLVPVDRKKMSSYIRMKLMCVVGINMVFYFLFLLCASMYAKVELALEVRYLIFQVLPVIILYGTMGEDMWHINKWNYHVVNNENYENKENEILNKKRRKYSIVLLLSIAPVIFNYMLNSYEKSEAVSRGSVVLVAVTYIFIVSLIILYVRFINEKLKSYENFVIRR